MTHSDLMKILENIAVGMAKLLGRDCEIALHDLEKYELVYIVNNHITGRIPGYRFDRSIYDMMINATDSDGHVVGHVSNTKNGKQLRSTHFVIRDENNKPAALICINQDVEKLKMLRDYLDEMLRESSSDSKNTDEREEENYIQKVTRKVIIDTIESMKPMDVESRECRLEVLRKLERQGVFAVRDAVPQVCKMLSISQATLYNYLRELRGQDLLAENNSLRI